MNLLRRLSDACEPALLRGIAAAIVALCGSLGVTLPFDLPGVADALITLGALLIPLAQAVATRAKVVPVAKVEQLTAGLNAAGLSPGPRA